MRAVALSRDRAISAASVVGLLVAWQALASAHLLPALWISSPGDVIGAAGRLVGQGELAQDIVVSTRTYFIGMAWVLAVGLPLGVIVGWYDDLRAAAWPFVSALNAVPRVALFPLFVLGLGIGVRSIEAMVFFSALLPVVLNTASGVTQLDPALLRLARSFGASDRQVFRTIALPSALPLTLAGLRLATGRGLIGLVVGELWVGQSGLGYLVASAGQRFATAELLVGALCVTAAGVAIIQGLRGLERRFEAWRPAHA